MQTTHTRCNRFRGQSEHDLAGPGITAQLYCDSPTSSSVVHAGPLQSSHATPLLVLPMPQAMLNRISFLRSEEAKLDRDIDVAKRRALELLSRKAEKAEKVQDAELAATAKDILEVVGPTVQTGKGPLRPTTGEAWQVGFG